MGRRRASASSARVTFAFSRDPSRPLRSRVWVGIPAFQTATREAEDHLFWCSGNEHGAGRSARPRRVGNRASTIDGSVRSFRLVQTEANLQRHLKVAEPLVFDVSTDAGDFEPIEVVRRTRRSLDGSTDSIINPSLRRTDDFADGVGVFGHNEFMPNRTGVLTGMPSISGPIIPRPGRSSACQTRTCRTEAPQLKGSGIVLGSIEWGSAAQGLIAVP